VAGVRLLWVPLLLAPAGVVFVATRTTIDPIAGAERLEVVPHLPAAIALPSAAIGITTPARHVTVHTRRRVRHPVVRRAKTRIGAAPRPVYVVPRTAVTHIVPTATPPHASHTPKPKPKPTPKPEPTPTPAPPTTTTPEPGPPPAAPPPEPPVQPTPTPAALPTPTPAPPAPTPAQGDGDGDDDQGEDAGGTRPGNGWGDPNHEHTGPPGHDGDRGRGH